ncbi:MULTISPECIES: fimbrillin family protein [Bacteroidales]|uniref:fimbrillin family protein n=1 Tax=Bacteroidales TaxID=171549 RepID=UPI001C223290|nr:fimbrillin family protein [Bacteroides eggerthii]MBU8971117.1 fimbrillin family protein [Bacteroides eggerthii]MBU8995547.1 fimbrillin family protein [Bacteroides eggerthii]MBU8995736.1 fimbrillin family protein [Bacteroides eggerthii]MCG4756999.1 fimbrillin family protein [Bacteroides eggerthii]MCG4757188.1 fimbrillin family protein [Bacteroides eggerthii]
MKTAIFRFFSFCFALLLLAACSRDGQPFLPDDTGKDDGDILVDIVVSRSTFTGAGDGDLDTKFNPGCQIGVSVDGSAAYQNVRYEYPASGSTLVAVDKKIYCGEHSASKVKAYYPYRPDGVYSTAFVEADQSISDNYYKSDALVADGTISNGALMLRFAHRMTNAYITFNEDVTDVTILNQSLNTSAVTGSSSIKAYKVDAWTWRACIVPGQTQLKVTGKKGGRGFEVVFNVDDNLQEGTLYTFRVIYFTDSTGKVLWDLSTGPLVINNDRTYYVTQSSGVTGNGITVRNGAPTIYIDGLNVSADIALNIENGNPTVRVVNSNTLKSTGFGASGIQVGDYLTSGSIKIVGSGTLTAIGGDQGCGIGAIYNSTGGWHINIEDCTVIAQANGADPAGIGARGGGAQCGNITIKNAMITSTGTAGGAGIGSGVGGKCGNITITLKQGDTKEEFLGRMKGYTKVDAGNGNAQCGTVTWHE